MDTLKCPYCDQEKDRDGGADFTRCRYCGFRSSMVDSRENGWMLVVDRRMPFLQRHCDELASRMKDISIVVDRRVAQDPWERSERRLNGYEEEDNIGRQASVYQPGVKDTS